MIMGEASASAASVSGLLGALKECTRARNLGRAEEVHAWAIQSGLLSNLYVGNALINVYAKCSSMSNAGKVFAEMPRRDLVSWNSLIQGYVDCGKDELALRVFDAMRKKADLGGCPRTYLVALSACTNLAAEEFDEDDEFARLKWLEKGESVYSEALSNRCCDAFVENMAIKLYSECKRMIQAQSVFDGMKRRDVVSWTSLLQGYVSNGDGETALKLYDGMQGTSVNVLPNPRTYNVALVACATMATKFAAADDDHDEYRWKKQWLEKGKSIHLRAAMRRCCDMFVESTAVDMYGKCGSMVDAQRVFDKMIRRDVVAWTALIQGYVENGDCEKALELFEGMESAGVHACLPNALTYVAALSACATLGAAAAASEDHETSRRQKWLEKGKFLHFQASKRKLCSSDFVRSMLIKMYAQCGTIKDARRVFDEMDEFNLVAWNCLVQGFVDNGEYDLALEYIASFRDRNGYSMVFDSATFATALTACGKLMRIETGRRVHAEILRCGLEEDLALGLIDFYSRSGSCMDSAKQVFDSTSFVRFVSVWNCLMCGYSQQGEARLVLQLFGSMIEEGVIADAITFTHILTACSHAGMAETGKICLDVMQTKYGIRADVVHYTCVVDCLARQNRVDEALRVVTSMPCEANSVTWSTLLSASEKWKNVGAGRAAFESLLKVDELDSSAYVFMSNMLRQVK